MHIILLQMKDKEKKILKASGENQSVIYSEASMQLMAGYSVEGIKAGGWKNSIFTALKEKKKSCQPRIISSKLNFQNEGKIKTISYKDQDNELLKEPRMNNTQENL